jgi:hypothetical protein
MPVGHEEGRCVEGAKRRTEGGRQQNEHLRSGVQKTQRSWRHGLVRRGGQGQSHALALAGTGPRGGGERGLRCWGRGRLGLVLAAGFHRKRSRNGGLGSSLRGAERCRRAATEPGPRCRRQHQPGHHRCAKHLTILPTIRLFYYKSLGPEWVNGDWTRAMVALRRNRSSRLAWLA